MPTQLARAVIGSRIARSRPTRILALVTLAVITAAQFSGELLDPIGVPGIWFPFGIDVSRTQYIYAITYPCWSCWSCWSCAPRFPRKRNARRPAKADPGATTSPVG